ncbi:MAG: TatD family hydrolase [Pyrodictiaceae archaeon]
MLLADAHLHSNPVRGLGAVEIARRFRRVGGWFIALVGLSPWHYGFGVPRSIDGYLKAYETHISECRRARAEGVRVSCLIGFHPADVDRLVSSGLSLDEILILIDEVTNVLRSYCSRGVIDGIGEVGRQHYKTMPIRLALAEYAMLKALEVARDYDCIVHLHLENEGRATVATTAKLLGLKKGDRVLFHHASVSVASAASLEGYWSSVPGRLEALRKLFSQGNVEYVVVESDFIDDPRRPCVAQCPWELARVFKKLIEENVIGEEDVAKINIENIVKFYGVIPP